MARAKRPPRAAKASPAAEILASEAAARLGMTKQAIGIWTARPGAPVRRAGARVYVRWPDFARWREQELVAAVKREAPTTSLQERRQVAEARQAEINMERAELALKRELGESVDLADYEVALGTILDRLTARLRGLPVQFSHLGPDVEATAEAEVERIVAELHAWDEDVVEDLPAPAADAEAA